MKILVLSDSHGDVAAMHEAVKKEKPHMVIHLGDHLKDTLELKKLHKDISMEFVKGNTDTDEIYVTEKLLPVSGSNIFITHGDRFDVETGLVKILNYGNTLGANIILFGHTHKQYLNRHNDVWVMNPGRIGRSSKTKIDTTYGIIKMDNQQIVCETFHFDFEGYFI